MTVTCFGHDNKYLNKNHCFQNYYTLNFYLNNILNKKINTTVNIKECYKYSLGFSKWLYMEINYIISSVILLPQASIQIFTIGYHKHVSIYFSTFTAKGSKSKNFDQTLKTELNQNRYIGEHMNWQRKPLQLGNFRRKHLKSSSQLL